MKAKRDQEIMNNSSPLICDPAMNARMIISSRGGGGGDGGDLVGGQLGFDFFKGLRFGLYFRRDIVDFGQKEIPLGVDFHTFFLQLEEFNT
jgi:hypothetical protein